MTQAELDAKRVALQLGATVEVGTLVSPTGRWETRVKKAPTGYTIECRAPGEAVWVQTFSARDIRRLAKDHRWLYAPVASLLPAEDI